MCHGDFPGNFFTDPRNRRLYEDCIAAMDSIRENDLDRSHNDDLTSFSHSLASSMANQIGLKEFEISHLKPGDPDIGQAIASMAENPRGTIVCAGAGGLMMPCHNTLKLIPGELRRVQQDNPALNLRYTGPCLDVDMAASIIWLSIKYGLGGFPEAAVPVHNLSMNEELNVVLISAPNCGIHDSMAAEFTRNAAMLSNRASRWHDAGICSETSDFMENVSSKLQAIGFSAVEAGFIDISSPGIEDAALRLVDKGADHIIVTGVPTLLHRHSLSIIDPDDAVKWLRAAIPYAAISYLKPEPAFIARLLSGHVISKVLDTRSGYIEHH